MAGPNSAPNGDTRIVVGHVHADYACEIHGTKHLGWCEETERGIASGRFDFPACHVVPLRHYLAKRNKLRTGKTI